jgi:hypothetical protein
VKFLQPLSSQDDTMDNPLCPHYFRHLTDAIPVITYPLNSQVPPVARLSRPFSYTFSSSTFYSDLPMTYTLSSAPSWLSLESSTRTLSGTPTANDVGVGTVTAFDVELTASDKSGSVKINSTFVISRNPAPAVSIPLSSQLSSLGGFSAPSTLLLRPSTPFEFKFQPGTFSENGSNTGLYYYAVTSANTPLPSWLTFDANTLSFSGRTPIYASLIHSPRTFGLQIIASDVEGFSGSSISFEIEVVIHTLAFIVQNMAINATAGANMSFSGISGNLELDGQPTDISSLASITAQTPPWLDFDNSTLEFSGQFPIDGDPCNITVQATDIYGDTATATIFVGTGPTTGLSSFSLTSPYVSSTPASAQATSHAHFRKRLIAAIVVPILLLVLVILCALFYYRLRRRAASQQHRMPLQSEKFTLRGSLSAVEAGLPPTVPPKSLPRDALTRVDDIWTSPCIIKHNGGQAMANAKCSMRQSPVVSLVSCTLPPEPLKRDIRESGSRADSQNTLHRSTGSWGSALTSPFPAVWSPMSSLSRQTSSCSPRSEKGHSKRFGRMWNSDQGVREILSSHPLAAGSKPNARDSNISFAALINFPILLESVDNRKTADVEPVTQKLDPTNLGRRRSRSVPFMQQIYSTVRHGNSASILPLARVDEKWRDGEHDKGWMDGQDQARSSTSWTITNTTNEESEQASSPNSSTAGGSLHLKEVTSGRGSACRPLSKPTGSLSLFGSSTMRRSRQLLGGATISSADAFAYPEEPLDPSDIAISHGPEENSTYPSESFETSFRCARESTKQLKDYIQSLLRRTWTNDSVTVEESGGSLFESTRGSMWSMHQPSNALDPQDTEEARSAGEYRQDDTLPYPDSEWSWESHYTHPDDQDDRGTVVEYETEDSSAIEIDRLLAEQSNLDCLKLGTG